MFTTVASRGLRILAIVASSLALAACPAHMDTQWEALAQASPCCDTLARAPAVELKADRTFLEIRESDPVVSFPTGNSHFRVVDLGNAPGRPKYVSVRSAWRVMNVFYDGGSWVPFFFPAVTFLTDKKQYMETLTESSPSAPDPGCETPGDYRCGFGAITVAVPNSARYAVIHTPARRVGHAETTPLPGQTIGTTILLGKTFVNVGGGAPMTIRNIGVSTGQVEVFGRN